MSYINSEVKPFKATAFHNGNFIEVTEADKVFTAMEQGR